MPELPKLIVVFGPTSSGKTDLSLKIAKYLWGKYHLESEIISTDSRQVYRGMNVGTSKISPELRQRYPHHFIDIKSPTETYTSAQFAKEARRVIGEITTRNHLPILVGGTGTFVLGVVGDQHLRKVAAKRPAKYGTLFLIPHFERPQLYRQIEANVSKMFRDGLYNEVKALIKSHHGIPVQLKKTHGYREFVEYAVRGGKDIGQLNMIDLEKIKWQIKVHTKKYAMHQSGWLKDLQDYHLVKNWDETGQLLDKFMKDESDDARAA